MCEKGEAAVGLHWLLEGLKTAPADDEDFRRVALTNLAAWADTTPGLRHMIRHGLALHNVAFSPDGRAVVTSSADGTAQFREVKTGKLIHELRHPAPVGSVSFSPDGKTIVVGRFDSAGGNLAGAVYLWDAAAGRLLDTLKVTGVVQWLDFTPGGEKILAAMMLDTRRARSRRGTRRTREPGARIPLPGSPRDLILLPGGDTVLTFCADSRWAGVPDRGPATGRSWATVVRRGAERSVAPARRAGAIGDGATCPPVAGPRHGQVRQVIHRTSHRGGGEATGLAPAASRSGSAAGGVVTWRETGEGRLLASFPAHEGFVRFKASPDGRFLVTGSYDRTARVWEAPPRSPPSPTSPPTSRPPAPGPPGPSRATPRRSRRTPPGR